MEQDQVPVTHAVIRGLHPQVVSWALPSPPVYRSFARWVIWEDGCDDQGNLLGWCPLHDAAKETEASAEFNFHKGIMRCQGDPRCHTKRAMSLNNVMASMADGV